MSAPIPKRHHHTAGGINLTGLIDVTFQLIIFFVLAGTFASAERMDLKPPTLEGSEHVADLKLPHSVVVQVAPYPPERIAEAGALRGAAAAWRVGPTELVPHDTAGLLAALTRARRAFAARAGEAAVLEVEVRADRSILYSEVEPVLACVERAGFGRVHYVALGSTVKDDRHGRR
ncbi:MAG: ExbD/TolR family protein [Planctomycetota bacterium]